MTKKLNQKGYFEYLLAIDVETSGFFRNELNSCNSEDGRYYQPVSVGLVVLDSLTLESLEELYVEIKWDEKSIWDAGAEKIHGLSKEYLNINGIDEFQAVEKIANLIFKYWGANQSVNCLGHNVHLFDYKFLIAMLERHGINLRKANRHVDTSSIGFATMVTWTSDQLFQTIGFDKRKEHNALDDVKMSIEVLRVVRKLWKSKIGLSYDE